MKKRLLSLILLVVTVCCAVFALSACGANSGNDGVLQMNKRYIYYDSVNVDEDEQTYYIFYSNGTGKYRKFSWESREGGVWLYADYTITFKYTFVDDDKSAVVCFYDSVEYGEKHNNSYNASSYWSELLTVSKNVLCTVASSGYRFYINDSYLKTIPNYRQ